MKTVYGRILFGLLIISSAVMKIITVTCKGEVCAIRINLTTYYFQFGSPRVSGI